MKITKLETQKNNKEKVNVFVDDKYSFSLTLNGLIESKLREGSEVTEEQISLIKKQDNPKLATLQALNIISYSMKTEKELIQKLKEKDFDDNSIEYAIENMKKYGYVDDEAYVISYIKNKAIPQKFGERKIIQNLSQKGIDNSLIKEKINELYNDDDKKENVMLLSEKYLSKLNKYDDIKKKQKLYNYLLGKGFSYDLISYACKKVFKDD